MENSAYQIWATANYDSIIVLEKRFEASNAAVSFGENILDKEKGDQKFQVFTLLVQQASQQTHMFNIGRSSKSKYVEVEFHARVLAVHLQENEFDFRKKHY